MVLGYAEEGFLVLTCKLCGEKFKGRNAHVPYCIHWNIYHNTRKQSSSEKRQQKATVLIDVPPPLQRYVEVKEIKGKKKYACKLCDITRRNIKRALAHLEFDHQIRELPSSNKSEDEPESTKTNEEEFSQADTKSDNNDNASSLETCYTSQASSAKPDCSLGESVKSTKINTIGSATVHLTSLDLPASSSCINDDSVPTLLRKRARKRISVDDVASTDATKSKLPQETHSPATPPLGDVLSDGADRWRSLEWNTVREGRKQLDQEDQTGVVGTNCQGGSSKLKKRTARKSIYGGRENSGHPAAPQPLDRVKHSADRTSPIHDLLVEGLISSGESDYGDGIEEAEFEPSSNVDDSIAAPIIPPSLLMTNDHDQPAPKKRKNSRKSVSGQRK